MLNISKHLGYTKLCCLLTSLSLFVSYPVLAETESEHEKNKSIPMEDVQRFSNALALIKRYYVKSTDDKELFDNAIRGMLTGLDPHSSYLNESELNELQTATNGEFGGLGIEVTMEEGIVKVITPLVDTPAYKAGIKAGDYIVKIDSKSVQGLELKDAVELMRGPIDQPIELTVFRKGESKPIVFNVVRKKIEIKSVQRKLLDNQYGYIRLAQFQSMTNKEMLDAIDQLKKESGGSLKGLILDLRNNPGGLLDSAIQISDAFLGNYKKGQKNVIVYTKGRLPSSQFIATANQDKDVLNRAPMVVLINNGSASASEIVAGALKDNKRAIILGTRSFGKGSVQTVLPLDEKRAIKLTTALYFTPSGKSIQAQGIAPDIVVEEIAVPQATKSAFKGFSEASLSRHLKNGSQNAAAPVKLNTKDEKHLLHEDYQLYAALTILKGLAVAQR